MRFKAIIWDIYGTLFYYNLGDLGNILQKKRMFISGIKKMLKKYNIKKDAEVIEKKFVTEVKKEHKRKERLGIKFPEVIAEDIMKKAIACSREKARNMMFFIERNINKPKLYKGAKDTLIKIKKLKIKQGIISNSQFYTPIILEQQLKKKLHTIFSKNLCLYSYKEGFSKPNPKSFNKLKKRLKGIKPSEVLFIGNDYIKDIYAAHKAGFKTVLLTKDIKGKKKINPDYKIREILDLLSIIK